MTALTMRVTRTADGAVRHVPTPFVPKPAKGAKKARRVPDPIKTNGETAAEQLRLLIERVERLDEEARGIADDKKDVLSEAKSRGYDKKVILMIIERRRKDRDTLMEQDAILETYLQSLGML